MEEPPPLPTSAIPNTCPRATSGGEARTDAGPAIVLAYAISGCSALCYTEFVVNIPVASGSFSFLHIELGDFIAFLAAENILLEAVVGAAGLGCSWSSYFADMIKNDPDFFRIWVNSFQEGFNILNPIADVILFKANGVAMSSTRNTSILKWLSSIATTLVIMFIIVVGFVHGKASNLTPFFPMGMKGVFNAAAIVHWSYRGFDMVATMAEETKNPTRDIPIGLVGSISMITVNSSPQNDHVFG
ncbi:hypothetical protein AHAS_Ahas12G0099700 [Arachis hypogaea]